MMMGKKSQVMLNWQGLVVNRVDVYQFSCCIGPFQERKGLKRVDDTGQDTMLKNQTLWSGVVLSLQYSVSLLPSNQYILTSNKNIKKDKRD